MTSRLASTSSGCAKHPHATPVTCLSPWGRVTGALLLLILLAACQPATPAAQTPSPRATLPPVLVPTDTPGPTPAPTHTPYPPLVEQGPYLMYRKNQEGPLYLVNANLQGRKVLELPEGIYIHNLQEAVSPDGKWLAFYTGSTEPPYDLALNLMSLPDGILHPVTKILSGEYPEDFAVVGEYYASQAEPGGYELGAESMVFPHSLWEFAWSPDGKHLAFSGQMDGPSSDLYLYTVGIGEIRRLTDDLRILGAIDWSPDGEWLVFTNVIPGVNYVGATLHRIRADETNPQQPPVLKDGFFWALEGWVSPYQYLLTGSPDGGESYGLEILDVRTGRMTDLWKEIYFYYALDPQDKVMLITGEKEIMEDGGILVGNYLVTYDGRRTELSESVYFILGFHGGPSPRFLGKQEDKLVMVTPDGVIEHTDIALEEQFSPFSTRVFESPDGKWFILQGDKTVWLFSWDNQLVKMYSYPTSDQILWSGDSTTFYTAVDNALYQVSMPDGEPVLVDQCLPEEVFCYFSSYDVVWLP